MNESVTCSRKERGETFFSPEMNCVESLPFSLPFVCRLWG